MSTAVLALLILVALFASQIAPMDPNQQDLARRYESPSWDHWLGTDNFGRDTFSRLVFATRVSLLAALHGVGIALGLGGPLGLAAGYRGGLTDLVASRFSDALQSLPPLLLAMAIVGALGPGLTNAMIAIGIALSPSFFRIARGAANTVKHEDYILAARADGRRTAGILLRHVLPNSSGPLLVRISFALGTAIIAEASLSFLGLGVQLPDASWGSMVKDAFSIVHETSVPIYPPALMISLAVIIFAVMGDGLRDALGRGSGRRI